MVNTFIFSLAVIACLVPSISGDNCKPGLSYCGSTLLQIGNYSDQVDAALKAQSLNTSAQVTANTLFDCIGGPSGDIKNTGQVANSTSSATVLPSPLSTTTVVIYPSASPTTPTKSSNDSNGSYAAPIVGGVIGGVVALALIGTMVFLFFRNKRHRQERSDKVLVPSVGHRPIGQQKPLHVSRPPNSRDFGSTAFPIEDERPVYEVPGFGEPRIHEAPTDARQELY
ncbi:hypothetical protein VB005_00259 [Metarhizium brunneum]